MSSVPRKPRPRATPRENRKPDIPSEAERLHDLGYWVVPCDGKKAVVKGWDQTRLTREQLSERLLGTSRNIAIVLNQSELIDVECDSGEAEAGLQTMFGGTIPPTPTWGSKRGKHRLFRRPDGLPEKAVIKLDGVEFRIGNGKGALSVVPPSVHPDGPRYEWLPGLSVHQVQPAELPAGIAERLRGTDTHAGAGTPADGTITEGQRNDILFRLACGLLRSGLSAVAVEAAVKAENQARCVPHSPRPNWMQ